MCCICSANAVMMVEHLECAGYVGLSEASVYKESLRGNFTAAS